MSFRDAWENVQKRTIAFNKGAGDKRDTATVFFDIRRAVREAEEAYCDGNPKSHAVPEFTECEERLASALSDIMMLSAMHGFLIPDAMAKRNTAIRNHWAKNNVDKSNCTAESKVRKRET